MAELATQNNTNTRQAQTPASSPFDAQKQKSRGRRNVSEYKKSLQEKQTLRNLYGLSEKQFKSYISISLGKMGKVQNIADELIKLLEKRLDNVVFRLGVAKSRSQARQLVSHGYFLINGKSVNVPSFQVSKGDIVSIKENKKKKGVFSELTMLLKKNKAPNWIDLDEKKISAKITADPNLADTNPPVEISLIFEFYSR